MIAIIIIIITPYVNNDTGYYSSYQGPDTQTRYSAPTAHTQSKGPAIVERVKAP